MAHIPLIAICGPTASGKTGLAVAVAQRLGGEVVSADSMQIYRRMEIGTAKPSLEEQGGIPHHLLDFLEPEEKFSVAQYVELARGVIEGIAARGKVPVLTGGTGLYIDSLTRGTRFAEMPENPALREQLRQQAQSEGNQAVWRQLQECDPELAGMLHPNNLGRVIRGIEVYRETGVPLSRWKSLSRMEPAPYDLAMFGIRWPRETLYRRIDTRVDEMFRQGLVQEAQLLYEQGLSATAAQAIGYKELFPCFSGDKTLEEAMEDIKRETRRYAKRQMTWLRRDERIYWLEAETFSSLDDMAETLCRIAQQTIRIG